MPGNSTFEELYASWVGYSLTMLKTFEEKPNKLAYIEFAKAVHLHGMKQAERIRQLQTYDSVRVAKFKDVMTATNNVNEIAYRAELRGSLEDLED